jgi:hypothetical protein
MSEWEDLPDEERIQWLWEALGKMGGTLHVQNEQIKDLQKRVQQLEQAQNPLFKPVGLNRG